MNDPTTSAEQDRLARLLRRGVWRTEVEVRRSELTHRLEVARVPPAAPPPRHTGETVELHGETVNVVVTVDEVVPAAGMPDAERRTHVETIESALGTARDAAGSPHSVLAWWSGSAVTLAWESVHAAEGELIEIESEAAVRSNLPHLVAWMAEVMEKSPQRDGYESALNAFADGTKPLNRTLIRQAHRDVTLANNERHASLRTFRNLLIAATGVLAALLFALALWHAINHQVVSLCGGPQTGARAARTCLSGPAPAGRDIFVVELIGAIAGMLSVAFALGALKTPPSRYNVRAAQAALKPVAGAATALIGVLLVQSHILIAPATSTSGESLLLAYAAVFGFSQQLLTQFVDKRAGALLGPSGSTPDANKAGT